VGKNLKSPHNPRKPPCSCSLCTLAESSLNNAGDYYGTALHELAHWTGHPQRLNRETLNESYRFGDLEYAKEELRAELASVFLMAERGIPHNPDSHAAYVAHWITALRFDKHEIFRSARDAHRAADLLIALELHQSIDQALAHVNKPQMETDSGAENVVMPSADRGKNAAIEIEL
jgi:antirestriction protein ArdC